jgi:hypothetical protein
MFSTAHFVTPMQCRSQDASQSDFSSIFELWPCYHSGSVKCASSLLFLLVFTCLLLCNVSLKCEQLCAVVARLHPEGREALAIPLVSISRSCVPMDTVEALISLGFSKGEISGLSRLLSSVSIVDSFLDYG